MVNSDFDPSLSGMHTQDEKVELNEVVSQPAHQDFTPIIMVLLIIIAVAGLVAWKVYSVWDENRPIYQKKYIPEKEVFVKVLFPEMQEYVRQNYPMKNKKLVVYAPELNSDTCPYRRDFVRALKQEKNNTQWRNSYEFVPQVRQIYSYTEEEQKIKLRNLRHFTEKICGYICIVDVHENWVFEIPSGSALSDALRVFE